MNEFRIFRALGLGFREFFKNFIPIVILTALLYSPIVLYVMSYKADGDGFENFESTFNHVFLYPLLAVMFVSALIAPMLTYRVIQDLSGNKVSVLTSIKYGFRGILPAIILAIVVQLANLIPTAGGIIGSIITCIWFVAAPAAVAERLGPFEALSRSAHLTDGRRWGIFGLLFLIGLIQIGLVAAWVVPLFTGDFDGGDLKSTLLPLIIVVGVFHMFTSIVEAVSYALLRQDKDGVSHEELARVFE